MSQSTLILHKDCRYRWRRTALFAALPAAIAWFACALEAQSQSTESSPETAVELAAPDADSQSDTAVQTVPVVRTAYETRPTLERVRELIELGTHELAYRIVVEERTNYEYRDEWVEWETLFFELGAGLGRWNDLVLRADQVRETGAWGAYVVAQTHAAMAQIQLGQYSAALQRLRKMILQRPEDRHALIEHRRLIAQIYLDEGNLEDAQIALSLFDRDYRPSDPNWEHRYIRILFLSGRFEEAMVRLAPLQTLEAQLLGLYAGFRTQALSASEVVSSGLELAPAFAAEPVLQAELWAVIEAAARSYNDLEMQAAATEAALSVEYSRLSNWDHLPVVPLVSEQQLLEIYDRFALFVGNDVGLIIGDDASWYQLAQEFEITSPATARAFHAYLARHSYSQESKDRSTAAFARSLFDDGLYRLLDSLFVRLNLLDVAQVEAELQTRLANSALRDQDYVKALTIINVMPRPEEPQSIEQWLLRQARLAIAVADPERSEQLLNDVIGQLPPLPEQAAIDRIMQVVFDLQKRDQHDLAIQFFVELYNLVTDEQTRREILRWIGESYAAKGDHANASIHLLRSAQPGDLWSDDWALSARLKAADELVSAGYIDDARVIYSQLHEDTIDPRSRALIANLMANLPTSR